MKIVFRRLKLFLLVVLLLLLTLEIGLHIFCHQKLRIRHEPLIYKADTIMDFAYIPNSIDYKSTPAFRNKIRINSLGFNTSEFSIKKNDSIFRIIFIGCSNETGFDTDGPHNYISLLAERFKKFNARVEILNCSHNCTNNDYNRIEYIRHRLSKYQPDLVFIPLSIPLRIGNGVGVRYRDYHLAYYEDSVEIESAKRYVDTTFYKFSFSKLLFKCSYSFRYLCKYYYENDNEYTKRLEKIYPFRDKRRIEGYIGNVIRNLKRRNVGKVSVAKSFNLIKEVNDSLKTQNSEIIVYNLFGKTTPIIKYIYDNLNIMNLDVQIPYSNEYDFGEVDGHFNQIGHKAISRYLFKKIVADNIIPDKCLDNLKSNNRQSNLSKMKYNRPTYLKLDSLLSFSETSQIQNDTFKVLIIHRNYPNSKKENLSYLQEIKKHFKGYEVPVILYNESISVNDDIISNLLKIDELHTKHMPNLILSLFPIRDRIENKPEILPTLREYQRYLNKRNSKLLFYDFYFPEKGGAQKEYLGILDYVIKHDSIEYVFRRIGNLTTNKLKTNDKIQYTNKIIANNIIGQITIGLHERQHKKKVYNISVNKPGSQSSTAYNGKATHAVDGNMNGEYSKGSVTHTKNELNSWWQVDLGELSDIAVIQVWNRTDVASERLTNFHIFVSDSPFISYDMDSTINQLNIGDYSISGEAGSPTSITINRSGRYVRIQLTGANVLSLAEVVVLGTSRKNKAISSTK